MSSATQSGTGPLAGALSKGARGLAGMAAKRVLSSVSDKVGDTTQRLTDYVSNGGGPGGLMGAITGRGGGGGGKGKKVKVTNIVEHVDVGVPLRLAYDQWTRFTEFPTFMKKVESVKQESDEKVNWKAQVFWSHRTWQSTIVEQIPDRHIVWRSEGPKGTVDGTVSFHELAPELTRIIVILQYHPQGFMEHTGNLWRAPGRRARLEIKHFARHVMTESILKADEVEGWRGEIRDGQVTKDNEQAKSEEEGQQEGAEAPKRERAEAQQKEGAEAPKRERAEAQKRSDRDTAPRESRRNDRAPHGGGSRTTRSRDDGDGGGREARRPRERLAS